MEKKEPPTPSKSKETEPEPSSTARTAASASQKKKKTVFGAEIDIDIPDDIFPSAEEIEKHEACLVGCEHGWMDSCHQDRKQSNPLKLHYRKFLPSEKRDPPKAIIIWIHGIHTHSGKGFEIHHPDGGVSNEGSSEDEKKVLLSMALLANEFVQQKRYALYALDLLGHGFSEGLRFYVKDWKENLNDCIQFVEWVASQHEKETPVFITGESYGGCLTLHLAHAYQQQQEQQVTNNKTTKTLQAKVDSVILVAPAIMGDLPPYPVYCFLRYVLARLYPLWVPFFMPNPVSPDRVWSDPHVLALHTQDSASYVIDGTGKPFRLGTAVQLLLALEACRNQVIPQFKMPFCVLHGTEDHAVPIVGTDFLEKHAATPTADRAIHRVEGAYHDLIGDWPTSKECMPLLFEWIQKRLDSQTKDQQE